MTEGKGASDEYERHLEQYRAITEVANDVIITIDKTSTIRSVNSAVEDVFGYTQEELIGDSLTTLMPEEYVAQHRAGLAEYLRTGERNIDWDYVELPGVRADGTTIPLGVSFGEIEYGGSNSSRVSSGTSPSARRYGGSSRPRTNASSSSRTPPPTT